MLLFRPVPLCQRVGRLRSLGCVAAEGARRRLLVLGIAWKWQAAIHGGLPKPLERRLAALEAGLSAAARSMVPRGPRRHPTADAGARLIRVWKGERHEVQVTESGYLWRGQSWNRCPPSPARSPAVPATVRPSSACARRRSMSGRGRGERRSAARSTRASPPRRGSSRTSTRSMPSARPAPPTPSRAGRRDLRRCRGSSSSRSPRPFKNTTSMGRLALKTRSSPSPVARARLLVMSRGRCSSHSGP